MNIIKPNTDSYFETVNLLEIEKFDLIHFNLNEKKWEITKFLKSYIKMEGVIKYGDIEIQKKKKKKITNIKDIFE